MSEPDTMGDRGASLPRDIFEALVRHGVDFVVIGGVAVIGHGSTRTTRDVDFVAATEPDNLARVEAAVAELDAQLWGVDAHLRRPGGAPYEQVRARSVLADLGDGLQIRIAGIDDLIAMKRAAGRKQDIRDIATLTHIERERGRA